MKRKMIIAFAMLTSSLVKAAPVVDIAVLLDTSGSMSGLIHQVRDGLWKTLNGLQTLK